MKGRLAAEFIGTFALVFAGTGSIVSNEVSDGTVTHVGIALTFGFVVLARSLAPAIMSGHATHLWLYLTAPVAGAILGVICCRLMRGGSCDSRHRGETKNPPTTRPAGFCPNLPDSYLIGTKPTCCTVF